MPFHVGFDYSVRKYSLDNCGTCGKEFRKTNHHAQFCSKECKKIGDKIYQKTRRKSTIEGNLERIVAGCRSRAKRKGLPCDIDTQYIVGLYHKQKGLCARTGALLEPSNENTRHNTNPNTISIDKVDPNKGYTKDNVELVTIIYNISKNNWTHNDVIKMAEGVLKLSH